MCARMGAIASMARAWGYPLGFGRVCYGRARRPRGSALLGGLVSELARTLPTLLGTRSSALRTSSRPASHTSTALRVVCACVEALIMSGLSLSALPWGAILEDGLFGPRALRRFDLVEEDAPKVVKKAPRAVAQKGDSSCAPGWGPLHQWSGPGGIRWDLAASVVGVPNGHEDPHCLGDWPPSWLGCCRRCLEHGVLHCVHHRGPPIIQAWPLELSVPTLKLSS